MTFCCARSRPRLFGLPASAALQCHTPQTTLSSRCGLSSHGRSEQAVAVDPTSGIKLLHGPNDEIGHHTWTQDELDRFEAHWPVGTRERLAYDLLLYTGLRRGDAVRLGRQHVRDGLITIRTEAPEGKAGRTGVDPDFATAGSFHDRGKDWGHDLPRD